MEFENFFSLNDGSLKNAIRLSPSQVIHDFEYVANGENLEKLHLLHEEGNKLYDFISLSIGGVFLVSPKVISVLKENDISGWGTYDVNLSSLDINGIQNYKALSIKGESGRIENELSEQATLPPLVPNGPERKTFLGMLFDIKSWDNSDIFSPSQSSFVYVTQKVKELFEEHNISNCSFLKITELENYDRVLGF